MGRSASKKTAKKSLTTRLFKSSLLSVPLDIIRWIGRIVVVPVARLRALRARRVHKSFQRSRRRDYRRPLNIPGYFAYTIEAASLLFRHRRSFILLSIVGTLLILVLGGLSSHKLYSSIADSFSGAGEDGSTAIQVGTLVLTSAGLAMSGDSDVQRVFIAIVGLLTWLTSVWLLREILAGQKPSLRDGLYSSGSPLVATAIVALIFLVQLIPIILLVFIYVALSATGLISEGLGAFLFFGVAALVITLTLYWVTSTLFAAVIITLPGMYPWQAMRAASDIVVGRRLRMLYRLIWMIIQVASVWVLVITPVVMLNLWLTGKIDWFKNVPLVPIISTWLTMALVIWVSAYIYLLYRKVVASDAQSSS